ncbi:MAG: SUMF1/EgtB/PvdO family nonheme iron enzyme [Planctomycetota bacterium]|jgi:formylglycine-generating enzyme required for sulfatase activity|nr:SUMF1/EgtB/PvdO family nonheme iron enzyme [Planctomycetota bacterium]
MTLATAADPIASGPLPGKDLAAEQTLVYGSDAGSFTVLESQTLWQGLDIGVDIGQTLKNPSEGSRDSLPSSLESTIPVRRLALPQNEFDTLGNEDFSLAGLLGKGGMGLVFSAKQTALNRPVAVKVIKPESMAEPAVRDKFINEAILTGTLDHPNIIPVYDLGRTGDGGVFYAMKEVKGHSWKERLPEMSEEENVAVLLRIADAVAFAHDRGVTHRDLKPENVMLGNYGEVLLMDWGLAALQVPGDAAGQKSGGMGLGGTPAYMPPEMARGNAGRIGAASDIYLLGAILYEIATGNKPHTGETVYACLANAANNVIVPTEKKSELVNIALRAMETNPDDRFPSVKDFQKALADRQRHMESEELARRANEKLALARDGGMYEHFNQAMFGFEEALALWPDNAVAAAGRLEARIAHANRAMAQGDFDLALEVANPLPETEPARERLMLGAAAGKRHLEEQRIARRRWRRVSIGLAGLAMAVMAVGSILVYRQMRIAVAAEARAVSNLKEAERQKALAVASENRAVNNLNEAERQRELAAQSEIKAMMEAHNARLAETEAVRQKEAAQKAMEEALQSQKAEKEARLAENQANLRTIAAMRRREEEEALRLAAQEEARKRTEEAARLGILTDASIWAVEPAAAARRQNDGARAAGLPTALDVDLGGGEIMNFYWTPVGKVAQDVTFVMGSPPDEPGRSNDEYLHPVMLTRPFYLARTELTRGQWKAAVGEETAEDLERDRLPIQTGVEAWRETWAWRVKPLPPAERNLPASGISFDDIVGRLLPKLAAVAPAGFAFRLPTEAEWECAARAGTITPFASGADAASAEAMGWLADNSAERPHPVGTLKANAWGFHDMHGNLAEMIVDFYNHDFYRQGGLLPDPLNDRQESRRVARGGSFLMNPSFARSAARADYHQANRYDIVGARLALAPVEAEAEPEPAQP